MKIKADSKELISPTEFLEGFLKTRETFLDGFDFPSGLVSLNVDDSAASTGELRATLNPSDGLLRFAAILFTRDIDSLVV